MTQTLKFNGSVVIVDENKELEEDRNFMDDISQENYNMKIYKRKGSWWGAGKMVKENG